MTRKVPALKISLFALLAFIASVAHAEFQEKPSTEGVLHQGQFVPLAEGEGKLGLLRADISGIGNIKTQNQEDQIIGSVRLKTSGVIHPLEPAFAFLIKQDEIQRRLGVELGTHFNHGDGQTTITAIPLGMSQGVQDRQVSQFAGIRILSEQNLANIVQLEAALESGLDIRTRDKTAFSARAGVSKQIGRNGFIRAMVFDGNRKSLKNELTSAAIDSADPFDAAPKVVFRAGFDF